MTPIASAYVCLCEARIFYLAVILIECRCRVRVPNFGFQLNKYLLVDSVHRYDCGCGRDCKTLCLSGFFKLFIHTVKLHLHICHLEFAIIIDPYS